MRQPATLLLALSLALGCAPPSPPATLRVATWNVRRLFDASCDSGSCAPGDFEAAPSPRALELQLDRVAAAIAALNADVVLLQELETAALLEALAERLGPAYRHAVFGESGGVASLDVGVLSRVHVTALARRGEAPLFRPDGSATRFTREVVEVRLEQGGRRAVVLVAHLKSKRDDDPGRRYAEAAALGDFARAAAVADPGALVVVGGDLNDVPGSAPLEALESGGQLCRVAAPLGAAAATHRYEGVDEAIDHLYVESADRQAPCPGTAWVVGDPGHGYGGSDHAALVGTLRWPDDTAGGDPGGDPG